MPGDDSNIGDPAFTQCLELIIEYRERPYLQKAFRYFLCVRPQARSAPAGKDYSPHRAQLKQKSDIFASEDGFHSAYPYGTIRDIMGAAIQTLVKTFLRFASDVLPEEDVASSKKRWNKLAEKNPRYYIVSKKGEGIEESDFKEIGDRNYRELVVSDTLLHERLGSFSDKRVLTIGCGIGRLEEFFAPHFKEVVGIDIAEKMVEQAKERLAHVRNAHFVATDGVSYPFENGSFDFVFSYLVFQHMPNKEVVEKNLREVARVLTPGGVAKIQLRGGHQPYRWQWFYGPSFTKDEAIALAKKAGLTVLKTEGEGDKRFWLWFSK